MSVKIRLARTGRNKVSRFRIVAADNRMKRDGRFLDMLGTYNPEANPKQFTINVERMAYWIKQGAVVSDTVQTLLKQDHFAQKAEAIEKGLDPAALTLERIPDKKRKPKNRAGKKAGASA